MVQVGLIQETCHEFMDRALTTESENKQCSQICKTHLPTAANANRGTVSDFVKIGRQMKTMDGIYQMVELDKSHLPADINQLPTLPSCIRSLFKLKSITLKTIDKIEKAGHDRSQGWRLKRPLTRPSSGPIKKSKRPSPV
ncbi:hypothetical protein DM01DRAFT_1348893 [Hesseltinella vesiculosa]|uniref:Uncharacterized protein n=1 Tax=Hesseltinella vesiculosa TaxID=101127 RepID=A0A1X2G744_9FUNG|nr:hypothetical protein DM01DRAFT_1348893 [Hesseltinella vesiculosa]